MSILFEPFTINGMTLRNRIVRSATHETMATTEGMPTDELRKLLERLADGKAGLIVAGLAYVNILGRVYPLQNGAHTDAVIPEWRKVVDAVHEKGAKIAMQIVHGGRQVAHKAPLAPSSLMNPLTFARPRPMTEEEIWQTIRDFGSAAGRAKSAGFDAVQIHAAHGYLISGFLSPYTNRRKDGWGGDSERRFRFLAEVYRAVREAVGPDFPVLCKLNVDDFLGRFGLTPRESFPAAHRLADIGVDALEISGGVIEVPLATCRGEAPIHILTRGRNPLLKVFLNISLGISKFFFSFRESYFLSYAEKLRPKLKIPLMLVGGIRRIDAAEQILEQGKADLISLSRPLVREFRLPKRWMEGDLAPARCVSCNRCFFEADRGNKVMCYQKVKIEEWIKKGLLKRD